MTPSRRLTIKYRKALVVTRAFFRNRMSSLSSSFHGVAIGRNQTSRGQAPIARRLLYEAAQSQTELRTILNGFTESDRGPVFNAQLEWLVAAR